MGKKKGQRGVTTKCYTEDTHPSPHFVTVAPSLVHIRSIRASSHPHTPTRMQHDRATAADGPCHQKVPRPEVRARHVRLGSSRAQRTVPVHQHGRRVPPVPDLLMDQGRQGSFAALGMVTLPLTSSHTTYVTPAHHILTGRLSGAFTRPQEPCTKDAAEHLCDLDARPMRKRRRYEERAQVGGS